MRKVSIITPVYNAEKRLVSSLGNLLHQTLDNIEVILVNDASSDNSLKIMHDAASQFPERVIIINSSENRGPGGARNLALESASGDYIGFADADDLVDTRMFQLLYEKALEGDYDIVDCGFYDEEHDRAICFTGDDSTGSLDDKKRSDLIVSGGYLWSRIYRRSLFENPRKLIFRERCTLSDADSLTSLLARASSIGNVKQILYRYHYDTSSVSRLLHNPKKYCQNLYDAMQAVYNETYWLPNYEGIREAVEYEILQMYSYAITMCYRGMSDNTFPDASDMLCRLVMLRRRIVELKNYKTNPYVRNKIPDADLNLMKKAEKTVK